MDLLEETPNKPVTQWTSFSKEEFKSSINKCNNTLISGPNKLSWRHLKVIINDKSCLKSFINIANTCINLGHWLSHFKMLTLIIIPKPNKGLYGTPKIFRPIILLNTLSKLIKIAIGKRLQLQSISKNVIYSCQLGRLKQQSTTDAGITLIYLIHTS